MCSTCSAVQLSVIHRLSYLDVLNVCSIPARRPRYMSSISWSSFKISSKTCFILPTLVESLLSMVLQSLTTYNALRDTYPGKFSWSDNQGDESGTMQCIKMEEAQAHTLTVSLSNAGCALRSRSAHSVSSSFTPADRISLWLRPVESVMNLPV